MRQTSPSPDLVHPAVRVGHVHLRVSDLDRAVAFYTGGLGFHVVADGREHGLPLVLVAADRGYPISHASDHGGTVAVYLADPDGNGIELTYDRPRESWFETDGRPVLRNDRIDLDALISEAPNGA